MKRRFAIIATFLFPVFVEAQSSLAERSSLSIHRYRDGTEILVAKA